MQRGKQRHRQREKQAPRRKPDVRLNPGTPGSRPEPKADAQPLSHPGVPLEMSLVQKVVFCFSHFLKFNLPTYSITSSAHLIGCPP